MQGEHGRIFHAYLDQKFISPAVQSVESLGHGDIKYQHTTIGATIKGYTKTLEAFLTGCVPNLQQN